MLAKTRKFISIQIALTLLIVGTSHASPVQASSKIDSSPMGVSDLTISGNAGIGGAALKYGYGFYTLADSNGNYTIQVPAGWSGKVIPSKQGYSFNPAQQEYTNLQSDQANQNYTAGLNTYTPSGMLGETWRVSVANGGAQPDEDSYDPSMSADGRYVAYWSFAGNLVPGDGATDVVLHDNQTGQTSAVSVDSNGTPLDCNSYNPSVSADGRYVAFTSCAWNLPFTVYVYDRHTGILEGADRGTQPSISADGRYVAYHSIDNPDFQFRVFVKDLLSQTSTQLSISTVGGQPDGDSILPAISANGRYVAFCSHATNLIDQDTNGVEDVFVYDLQTDDITRVSVHSNGTEANGGSCTPSISGDGRYVAFYSAAINLTSNDTNGVDDVFVHDLQTGTTSRISVSNSGIQGNLASDQAHISASGRYVSFRSQATNLVANDTNGVADILMYDRQTGNLKRVSVDSNGAQGNGDSPSAYSSVSELSSDGKYLAFSSDATNLVIGDTNSNTDVFVHENENTTFSDVLTTHPYWQDIEILYANGYTAGCSMTPLLFCPDLIMNRAQAAVFMVRGSFGGGYVPVTPTHFFGDNWSKVVWAEGWAESMFLEGLTGGCSTSSLLFCPEELFTNVQAAVLGLRMKHGVSFQPPAASGTVFADLTNINFWGTSWAEQAHAEGLLPACGTSGGKPLFCPNDLVSRGFGASIIVKAKGLTMP